MVNLSKAFKVRIRALRLKKKGLLRFFAIAVWIVLLIPHVALAEGFHSAISGYAKSLNFFTQTSGFVPEFVNNPTLSAKKDQNVFSSLERLRLQGRFSYDLDEEHRVKVKVDYDNQAYFGSFVPKGDFRIARNISEARQFLDLSHTLVENSDALYEHRLYRATIRYEGPYFDLEMGRQQIPWGVGRFFTPTDFFNPFNPTQIELDERDGVDAVNLITRRNRGYQAQLIYTPSGRHLHPQRYMARVSKDVAPYEMGLLGGRIDRDHAVGFDVTGTAGDFAVRGEVIYREAQLEKDFVKFTLNADYNLPYNIYTLVEYHYNGQGRRSASAYQQDRLIEGEIQQLGKNYLALSVGHDLTSLIRLENRTIYNMDDQSFFERPEIQYEVQQNMLLTAGAQLYLGGDSDEFGKPKNLFLIEGKYSF